MHSSSGKSAFNRLLIVRVGVKHAATLFQRRPDATLLTEGHRPPGTPARPAVLCCPAVDTAYLIPFSHVIGRGAPSHSMACDSTRSVTHRDPHRNGVGEVATVTMRGFDNNHKPRILTEP